MTFYPPKIQERFASPKNDVAVDDANAGGKSVSFQCGSFVSFSLRVDAETKMVTSAGFQTNGCGYMIASADFLVETIKYSKLSDLHGLNKEELSQKIDREFGILPDERSQCVDVCIEALRVVFAGYRVRQIEEFRGEKALICTCFGVSEETIEAHIKQDSLETVDEVTQICNAGGGCGSCRMLIQEMIDTRNDHI